MKKYLVPAVLGIVLQCTLATAFAGGTVDFVQDVQPIIMQRPFFAKFLFDTFDFEKSADAVTIGREVNPQLAGYRIGPYTVFAKKKGTAGPYNMEVVIDTNVHFFDAKGIELNDAEHAKTVKEDFYAVEVNPFPSTNK